MTNIFILLIVFQLKHFIVDYPLQTEYHLGKFKDSWEFFWPLFNHSFLHAAAVGNIVIWFGGKHPNLKLALLLALFNGTIHFFMDRIKAGKKYMGRWKPLTAEQWMEAKKHSNPWEFDYDTHNMYEIIELNQKRLNSNRYFWWSIGFDQMIHHLTDIACIYFMVR